MPTVPESAVELSEQHHQTYQFYRECVAVGHFPSDPRVRWAAAIIRATEDRCEKDKRAMESDNLIRAQAVAMSRAIQGAITRG
jgi:hypothetical protein